VVKWLGFSLLLLYPKRHMPSSAAWTMEQHVVGKSGQGTFAVCVPGNNEVRLSSGCLSVSTVPGIPVCSLDTSEDETLMIAGNTYQKTLNVFDEGAERTSGNRWRNTDEVKPYTPDLAAQRITLPKTELEMAIFFVPKS